MTMWAQSSVSFPGQARYWPFGLHLGVENTTPPVAMPYGPFILVTASPHLYRSLVTKIILCYPAPSHQGLRMSQSAVSIKGRGNSHCLS